MIIIASQLKSFSHGAFNVVKVMVIKHNYTETSEITAKRGNMQ